MLNDRGDPPRKLSELGIEFRLDPKMIDDVLPAAPAKNNPREADRTKIAQLFEKDRKE